jgi:serine phosphatase RsbU (regulator of sigma subunit)
MVLGIFPENVYAQAEVAIAPGDRVVFYTDGITEARNPRETSTARSAWPRRPSPPARCRSKR